MSTKRECRNFVKEGILKALKSNNEPMQVSMLLHQHSPLPFDSTVQFFTSCLADLVKAGKVERVAVLGKCGAFVVYKAV